jgi:hypothetical protein
VDRSRKTFYQKEQQEKLYKTHHKKKTFEELVVFVVDYPWNDPGTIEFLCISVAWIPTMH